ncbi:hypothetical protein WN943_004043 [Citrus x changshan-huyou]
MGPDSLRRLRNLMFLGLSGNMCCLVLFLTQSSISLPLQLLISEATKYTGPFPWIWQSSSSISIRSALPLTKLLVLFHLQYSNTSKLEIFQAL